MTEEDDAIIIGAGVIGAAIAFELVQARLQDGQHRQAAGRGLRPDEQLVRDRPRALLLARGRRDGLRGLLLLAGLGRVPRRRGRIGPGALHAVRHGAAQERHRPPREGARATTATSASSTRSGTTSELAAAHADLRHGRLLAAHAARRPALLGRARRASSTARSSPRARATSTTRSSPPTTCSARPRPRAASSSSAPRSPRSAAPTAACAGVTLTDGAEIDAPVVVNVAGPHSFVINRMAGVEEGMNVKTRALRHEVHHVPGAAGLRLRARRLPHLRRRHRDLLPPRERQQHPHRLRGPRLRPAASGSTTPTSTTAHVTEAQWEAQVYRLARRIPSLRIPNERKGIVDLYDVSDDWIPIYDRSDLDGFYMAIGTSGNQFKNAAGRRPPDGRADRPRRARPRPRRRPVKVTAAYTEARPRRRLLLAPARGQPELELLGQRLSRPRGSDVGLPTQWRGRTDVRRTRRG